MSGGEAGVSGGWWLVEPLVFVVCFVGVEDSRAGPAFDGAGVHAQPSSDLGVGEQAFGAESVGVAGQVVAAACVEHDAGGKRLALAGAVTGVVKRLGGLGVGVGVEEPVEGGEGVGVGLAELPGFRRDRDNVAGGLSCGSPEIVEGFLCRFRLGLGFPDLVVDG